MFYGEYEHTIDNKGRLSIPSKFREVFKGSYVDRFFITRGLDTCLFVFAEDEWRRQEHKFKALPFTSSEARQFNRLFFSGASEVSCDAQGRILVPPFLKEFAQIEKDVMVVGVGDRFEIWGKDKWKEFYDNTKDSFESVAEKLLGQQDKIKNDNE